MIWKGCTTQPDMDCTVLPIPSGDTLLRSRPMVPVSVGLAWVLETAPSSGQRGLGRFAQQDWRSTTRVLPVKTAAPLGKVGSSLSRSLPQMTCPRTCSTLLRGREAGTSPPGTRT